ncbi:hypothetical protein [Nocardia sp. NPDC003345]
MDGPKWPVAEAGRGSVGAVPGEDEKYAAHRALVDRVLNADGRASREQRARAFAGSDAPPPLRTLLGNVVTAPGRITDAEFAAAKSAGFDEDQLFEMVVCAAVGRAARLYDSGLAALAAATADEDP